MLHVKEEDIVEDYTKTKEFMKMTLNKYAGNNSEILNIITPKKMYMEEFLKEFKIRYDNIETYLKIIGIEEDVIKKIKTKYIE